VAGWLACILMLRLAAWLGKSEERQFILMVGTVVVTVGVAHALKLSVSLALLTLGMLARNLDRGYAVLPVHFGHGSQLFFVILFVLVGASLEFSAFSVAAGGAGGRARPDALPRQGPRAARLRTPLRHPPRRRRPARAGACFPCRARQS
jgi:NhaP-type Na+/H+ or K+/H+ antiporter